MSDPTSFFAEAPIRDERFDVKERWSELRNLSMTDPAHQTEFLHRQMNEEINSIEISARNLTDFPDADWELRMTIARQCYDESRHALAFRRILESRGGRVGEFPVLNFQYRIITKIDSLAGRLAVQNRSFEAAGIDAIEHGLENFSETNDADFVELFDMQLADEMQHVRYGNEWVKKLIDRGGARVTFEVARAVAQASDAFRLVADADSMLFYPVSDELRREAGFNDREIESARALAKQNV